MLVRCILFLCLWGHVAAIYKNIIGLSDTAYKLEGDINIGGMFPLHDAGHNTSFCGPLRELGVLQRAEAMAFYIQEINKDSTILPNITLGFTILDDCYKETTALARGLQFVPQETEKKANGSTNVGKRKEDVVAVIGAESSTNSKQLAELLGLFAIPQISYLSTSPILGNNILFPYFSRIVPSDKYQISAMIDLMQHFNWTYISFVYSISFYGIHAYLLLLERLRLVNNICLAVEYSLPENPTERDYDSAVESLVEGSNGNPSHVVILFLSQTAAMGMLKSAKNRGLHGKFTWIASDAWGRNVQDFRGVEDIAEGTLTIKLASKNDWRFDRHFAKLTAASTANPYLREFWNATCNSSQKFCSEKTTFDELDDIYKPESTVGLVKIAVYFLAQSLDEMYKWCKYQPNYRKNRDKPCSAKEFRDFISGEHLQPLLYRMSGAVDGNRVDVDMGEGKTRYSIMNFRRLNSGKYDLNDIGSYDTQQKKLNMSTTSYKDASWNSAINDSHFTNVIPRSVCSRNCEMGQKQIRKNFYNSKCCWVCEDCKPNEYTKITKDKENVETYQCVTCEMYNNTRMAIFTTPSTYSNQCHPIVPESIGLGDPFGIVIICVDIICTIVTIGLLVVYTKNKTHRLIKATSLELSYIIWSGVLFSYLSILCYFMPLHSGCVSSTDCDAVPNMHWCYFQYITFSLSFTIINAPMLTRANRIYRIFNQGKKSAAKPRFIESRYQLMFSGILVLCQGVIVTVCCVVSHFAQDMHGSIRITNYQDDAIASKSYISCEIPISLLMPPVIYNLLLGIACAYHAVKTRRLPDNFKESRFIGMTVYTTVIMWIAFIPAYLSINSRYYKSVPLSIAMLINALITTSCLFAPRLYALRWVEGGKMNLRSFSISLQSIGDKSRKSSVPEAIADRRRSMSSDSTKYIMSTPDIISATCFPEEKKDDVSTAMTDLSASDTNTVTFQEPTY